MPNPLLTAMPWRRTAAALAVLAAGLTLTAGPSAADTSGSWDLRVHTTQEAPYDGEQFTLSIDAADLDHVRATSVHDPVFTWTHDGDCTLLTPTDAETLTAACPLLRGKDFRQQVFTVTAHDGERLAGDGGIGLYATAPSLGFWSGGIDKRSVFAGELYARGGSIEGALADATVEIHMLADGDDEWRTLATATTDARGLFKIHREVRAAGLVRAHFAGDGTVPAVTSKAQRLRLQPTLSVTTAGRVFTLTLRSPWGEPLARKNVFVETGAGERIGDIVRTDRRGRARIELPYRPSRVVYANSYLDRTWAPARTPVRPR